MARIRFRILAAGLGVISLPACVTLQADLIVPPTPGATTPAASPTATPVATPSTVKRVDPTPPPATTPVQYIAVPADQLVRDASGRTLVKASAIPPGYVPVAAPPQAPAPVATPAAQLPAAMPVLSSKAVPPATPAVVEPVEVVAVTHTAEPPLAPPDPPKPLPETVRQVPAMPSPPLPAQRDSGLPTYVPPGAQVLVLQPDGKTLQPAAHSDGGKAEPGQNMLIPPVAPEELKLVSQPRAGDCNLTPIQAALEAYQAKSPQTAEKQLQHLDPVNRDLLKKVLPLAAKLGDQSLPAANPAEVAEMVDQLQQVVGSLRSKATLQIAKLSYCRLPAKPARYGVYQPLPDDHTYRIGETVELYMELRNFSCEAKEAEYRTHLSTVIEIRNERNELVERHEFERDRPEVGQAPKQDYFHICRFPVRGFPAGTYTMTVIVTDVPTGKSATRTLPLRVESAPRRVARGTAG
jgi:hypothetical protein